jgi:hypothetical protein
MHRDEESAPTGPVGPRHQMENLTKSIHPAPDGKSMIRHTLPMPDEDANLEGPSRPPDLNEIVRRSLLGAQHLREVEAQAKKISSKLSGIVGAPEEPKSGTAAGEMPPVAG